MSPEFLERAKQGFKDWRDDMRREKEEELEIRRSPEFKKFRQAQKRKEMMKAEKRRIKGRYGPKKKMSFAGRGLLDELGRSGREFGSQTQGGGFANAETILGLTSPRAKVGFGSELQRPIQYPKKKKKLKKGQKVMIVRV